MSCKQVPRYLMTQAPNNQIQPLRSEWGQWCEASDVEALEQKIASLEASLAIYSDAAKLSESTTESLIASLAQERQENEKLRQALVKTCRSAVGRVTDEQREELLQPTQEKVDSAMASLRAALASPAVQDNEQAQECILGDGLTCLTHGCGADWVGCTGYRCDVTGKVITKQVCTVCGSIFDKTVYPQHVCGSPAVPAPEDPPARAELPARVVLANAIADISGLVNAYHNDYPNQGPARSYAETTLRGIAGVLSSPLDDPPARTKLQAPYLRRPYLLSIEGGRPGSEPSVGCRTHNGPLHIHLASETCELCAPLREGSA